MAAVRCERRGTTGWIRLERPEAMNAIDALSLAELEAAIAAAEGDAAARTIAFTGTARSFCAGADLKYVESVLGQGDGAIVAFLRTVMHAFGRIEGMSKPTIAALNGMTVAGGLELALCCDYIVAAKGAKVGDGHANFGILPGGGSSVRLPRRIGAAHAKRLLFSGAIVSAADALALGLVDELVEDETLEAAVEALAASFTAQSPLVLRRMKSLVAGAFDRPAAAALEAEIAAFTAHASARDLHEGLAAFREKRAPLFSGD